MTRQTAISPVRSGCQPAQAVQRKCACGTHTIAGSECQSCRIQKLPFSAPGDAHEREAEQVAREVMHGEEDAPVRPPGTSGRLPGETRSFYESRFGHDFSTVLVHTGSAASAATRAIGARAFTYGEHVVVGEGEYKAPVLAHELTHVVQQRGMGGRPLVQGLWSEIGGALAFGALGLATMGLPGLLMAGVGVLAGMAFKEIFGLEKKTEDAEPDTEKIPPEQLDENNPAFWKRWEKFLNEGLEKMYASGCPFPGHDTWRYDKTYWERVDDPQYVAYKPKNATPAKAVDALFETLSNWEIDCALYPEIAHLYAYRHALGRDKFNSRFKDLKLRAHETTGIAKTYYDSTTTPADKFNKLWDESPVGTKVMWSNRRSITVGTAWQNENAIKSVKGDTPDEDRYDAQGVRARKKPEPYIKRGLAENADDFPKQGSETQKQSYVDQNVYRHQLQVLKRPDPGKTE